MKIQGIEGMSGNELTMHLQTGGRFVIFQYCVSIIVLTFRRSSDIYFVKGGESVASKGLIFTLISFLFGWWGIPWGPIYTIQSIMVNLRGGKDITQEVVASLAAGQK